jgi:hypothetical protein
MAARTRVGGFRRSSATPPDPDESLEAPRQNPIIGGMNCPKCSTPAAAGASHCRRCGAALTAKAAAPSAVPEEYDLLPMEPTKAPSYTPYEEPPASGGPTSAAPTPGTKSRTKPEDTSSGTKSRKKPDAGPLPELPPDIPANVRNYKPPVEEKESKTGLLIGGVLLGILLLFIGWRMLRPKHEIVAGQAKIDSSATLNPNQVFLKPIEIVGTWRYSLEVHALDSEISVGVFRRGAKDRSTLADLKKLPEGFDTANKGEAFSKSGELTTGAYVWVLVNEGKKPARVKFKFLAE